MKIFTKTNLMASAVAVLGFAAVPALACGGNACVTPDQYGGGSAYGEGAYTAEGGAGSNYTGNLQDQFAGSGSGGNVEVGAGYRFDSCDSGNCEVNGVSGYGNASAYQFSDSLVATNGPSAGSGADGYAGAAVGSKAGKYVND